MIRILAFVTVLTLAFSQLSCAPAFAMAFGMYQPEEEYGLIDGFKFNFFKKRAKGEKLIEIRSETPGEKERLEREKLKPQMPDIDENEQYRFLREGVVPM